jgi:hypothetical protein
MIARRAAGRLTAPSIRWPAGYSQERQKIGVAFGGGSAKGIAHVGVNLGAFSDIRLGAYIGRLEADVQVGDPGLPSVTGKETAADLTWRDNGQDSPAVPSRGVATFARILLERFS